MNSDIFEIIKQNMGLDDINITDYSPLTLAYIGDGIYEIVIRTVIVDEANRQVNKIHKAASNLVKAGTQAKMIHYIMELTIYKRGRNAKAVTRAKNASMSEYRTATGFEALMGWLYLTGQSERMMKLIKKSVTVFTAEDNNK